MKVITGNNVLIKSWCDNPEEGAVNQARVISELPFVFRHVALMPDTHLGYGMPIGGVAACEDVIIPNMVGKDVGCGMCAMKSNYSGPISKDTIKSIMGAIRKVIPMGLGKNNKNPVTLEQMPKLEWTDVVHNELSSAVYQLGSLGSGNHFIELQRDQWNYLWIMIHSGSRNLGSKIANHYNELAISLNKKWYTNAPKDLAWLPVNSDEGRDYIKDMKYATEFAFLSRKEMMDRAMKAVVDCTDNDIMFPSDMINIHHNFARLENHFGKNVWVHRKGATSAKKGETGIIPGSQGSNSYIVEGLGNRDSFMSCSHGAGRKMGRKDAQRRLDLDTEIKRLDDIGVVHNIRNISDLDEATGAYKSIDLVMKEQEDLVKITYKLTPIGVLKG